jgi:hypothetical protein
VLVPALSPRWAEGILSATVVATIVSVSFGSSSVPGLVRIGHDLRWVSVALFAVVAVVSYAMSEERRVLARVVVYAGLSFIVLLLLSTAWSVAPRLTIERALTLAVLFVGVVASVSGGNHRRAEHLLDAILVGAGTVVLLGLPVLLFAHNDAVQSSFENVAPRYRGIGENPNTVSLLAAIALPLAIRHVFDQERPLARISGAFAVVAFAGQIALSDSRGALIGGFVGASISVILPAARIPRAIARFAAVAAVAAMSVGFARVIERAPTVVVAPPPSVTAPRTGHGTGRGGKSPSPAIPAEDFDIGGARLNDEVGAPAVSRPIGRPFGSGRVQAWIGATKQARKVAPLGYGFGTEDRVFIDRYYTFQGSRPENSFVGLLLQVGLIGLTVFLVLVVAGLSRAIRVGRKRWREEAVLTAALAATCAGAVLMLVQSYVYSVGNIATLSFWLCFGVCATAAAPLAQTHPLAMLRRRSVWLVAAGVAVGLLGLGRWQRQQFVRSEGSHLLAVWHNVSAGKATFFRIAAPIDCLGRGVGHVPFALEACFDEEGRLVQAMDRRVPTQTKRWSLEFDSKSAPLTIPPRVLIRRFQALGALRAYGDASYLPSPHADLGPTLVRSRG